MECSSEKELIKATDDVRTILGKFNIEDALYILTKVKIETEMQMLGFDEEKIKMLTGCKCK